MFRAKGVRGNVDEEGAVDPPGGGPEFFGERDMAVDKFERAATAIAILGKGELKRRIKSFPGRFKFDFTDDYLNRQSVDRLRHILLAATLKAGRN